MDTRKYIDSMGFIPKENTKGIYCKTYNTCGDYAINIDIPNQRIDYGPAIASDSKTTQNFSQAENFVVLECVDRLLRKGYQPNNIVLEKTWPSGHGTSGRLDICVNREDGSPYLLIECKTYGREFDRELAKINKDGGQLLTYFQLSGHKADVLMLYASEIKQGKITYRNEIIKIEDEYRSGEVKDIYEKWNKLTRNNGIFDKWVMPYNFQNKAITKEQLKEITDEDSSFIFNRFLEILRHNVVSDKGNAFNKIFTLFLCKVYDETSHRDGEELDFQWKEGRDNHVDFQLRLTDLYRRGMEKFLKRTVSDFDRDKFDQQFAGISSEARDYLLHEVNKLRLEKNNEFAIKEVYDHASFEENAHVVKEVVELLQGYRIRYNKRQQYLSDFFELLLTTGLKQEVGQFFTPVPIAQFVIKSLPIDSIVRQKLTSDDGNILPYMIDYASGSGHFITEYMHEVQNIINMCNGEEYIDETRHKIENWQRDHFDWATQYVYGIEKDYRLVKVGKVGCYLHGDGLANVILSDGLARFTHDEYTGRLHKSIDDGDRNNPQFDIILSNPPYSVSAFRQTTRKYYTEKDFELYDSLTDNSSEIECLFIERTKQLLKEGGVAGVILPSSILSNNGIETKARELILKYFDIVGIAEMGSNTFMATDTTTVVFFLRRRDNYLATNVRTAVDKFIKTQQEVTVNGLENPFSKYAEQVWQVSLSDYCSLLCKTPSEAIKENIIYKAYLQDITSRFWDNLISIEREKLLYFILAYKQQVVVVKSGEKKEEKQFLGYEFSSRRGNEGIHSIVKGKKIDECTQLFDPTRNNNPDKASTYIQQAFSGDYSFNIPQSLKSHLSLLSLSEMLDFSRGKFDKNIRTSIEPKVTSRYPFKTVASSIEIINSANSRVDEKDILPQGRYPVITQERGKLIAGYANVDPIVDLPVILFGDHSCAFKFIDFPFVRGADGTQIIKTKDDFDPRYFYYYLSTLHLRNEGHYERHLKYLKEEIVPLPPMGIQRQIAAECQSVDDEYRKGQNIIENQQLQIEGIFENLNVIAKESGTSYKLSDNSVFETNIGRRVLNKDVNPNNHIPVYSANVFEPFGMIDHLLIEDFSQPSILWGIDGDWMVNLMPAHTPFYPTDHCGVLRLKTDTIHPRYMAWLLQKAGEAAGFKRSYRASIDRIKSLSIRVAPIERQLKAMEEVLRIETLINNTQQQLKTCSRRKQEILQKYLH